MTAPVKERPILFSAPMVRAILDGRKTVTRRIVTVPWKGSVRALPYEPWWVSDGEKLFAIDEYGDEHPAERCLPGYGEPGDRLWVKETWQAWRQTSHEHDEWEAITKEVRGDLTLSEWFAEHGEQRVEHRATSKSLGPWTPSIFMPRWASRITLEVVSSRIERLHAITEEDARAEGVFPNGNHLAAFNVLWNDINGGRDACWPANPWVWRVEFRRLEPARTEGT